MQSSLFIKTDHGTKNTISAQKGGDQAAKCLVQITGSSTSTILTFMYMKKNCASSHTPILDGNKAKLLIRRM
jgi:hypothetical protein